MPQNHLHRCLPLLALAALSVWTSSARAVDLVVATVNNGHMLTLQL